MKKTVFLPEQKRFPMPVWWLVALGVFLWGILPLATSEFWYDEVLSLTNFVLDFRRLGVWRSVCRCYPIANNHILSNALEYFWLHSVPVPIGWEELVRIPAILASIGTITLIMFHWRGVLGDRLAAVSGILFAVSPVFTAYAWQMRGYALTIFLASLACSGLLDFLTAKRLRGAILLGGSCLLLPLVIPSNAMLAPVLAFPLFFCEKHRTKDAALCRNLLLAFGLPGGMAALGLSYYLTMYRQFLHALQEPDGWPSSLRLFGALAAGAFAHCLPLAALSLRRIFQKPYEEKTGDGAGSSPDTVSSPPLPPHFLSGMGLGLLLAVGGSILGARAGHYPFPRVFLVLLPPFSLLVFLAAKKYLFRVWGVFSVAVVIVLCGMAVQRLADARTLFRMRTHAIPPDNLLQQYYRGSTELRESAALVREIFPNAYILTDLYDQPSFQFYWCIFQGNGADVQSLHQTLSIPENRPTVLIARTPQIGQQILDHAGAGLVLSRDFMKLKDLRIRQIYLRKPHAAK